jgi:hypothetical protein
VIVAPAGAALGGVPKTSFVADPAFAVAWNVRLCTPAADATSVCGPAAVPSVHDVNCAKPCTSVLTIAGDAGAKAPLP